MKPVSFIIIFLLTVLAFSNLNNAKNTIVLIEKCPDLQVRTLNIFNNSIIILM